MARSGVSAPRHDIAIFKALEKEDNAIIRMAGTKTLARHLWYLFEDTVGITLFDEELSLQEPSVTNDAAKRGVALVLEFTRSGRTKAEDQLQFFLQVVEGHLKEFLHRTNALS